MKTLYLVETLNTETMEIEAFTLWTSLTKDDFKHHGADTVLLITGIWKLTRQGLPV